MSIRSVTFLLIMVVPYKTYAKRIRGNISSVVQRLRLIGKCYTLTDEGLFPIQSVCSNLEILDVLANCGYPGKPENGFTFGNNFKKDGVVRFICNNGYNLTGSPEITCQQKNARWSDSLPTCECKLD